VLSGFLCAFVRVRLRFRSAPKNSTGRDVFLFSFRVSGGMGISQTAVFAFVSISIGDEPRSLFALFLTTLKTPDGSF
jgi:hypothetical protein